MKEENLGSAPEDPGENLKAAEGKNISHHARVAGAADEMAGVHTGRGRYGEAVEEKPEAQELYPASNKLLEEPEAGSLK